MSKWSYTVTPDDAGLTLKEIIRRNFTFSSRMMTRFKQNGCISVNGETVRISVLPDPGDIVSISLPDERSGFDPQDVPIAPVHEDDDLLIIDKPAGYTVHPTKGHPAGTIANGLAKYIADTGQTFKVRFVNRLDMDTSGLLVIAKSAFCQDRIINQMKEDAVVKKYIAVVNGVLEDDEGKIEAPVGRPDPEKAKRGVTRTGSASVTRFSVIERYKRHTLVELDLKTGRTHQIRVHMSHIGHPVTGDRLYGGEDVLLIERQALHACYISFLHPVTGEPVEAAAEIPEDMKRLIEKIRSYE